MLRWLSFSLGTVCAGWLLGCEVQIGDECTTASECSQEEPRLCLTDALEHYPGGYCTVFNCDPGTCPSEAVCVGYRSDLSNTPECSGPFGQTRLQRTFCMRSCSGGSDCRPGYACLDLGETNPWGAEVLENEGRNTKVCALAYSGPEAPEDRSSDVCRVDPNAVPLPSVAPTDAAPDASTAPTESDASTPPTLDASTPPTVDASTLPTTDASTADASTSFGDLDASSALPTDAGSSAAATDAGSPAGR